MANKTYQLRKAWHVLKAEGLLPTGVPDGHPGPLMAYQSIDDELPTAIVAWNQEDGCFGVLAKWPLQGRLLHLLNAVRDRKLESVEREPVKAETAEGVEAYVRQAERGTGEYQRGLQDGNPGRVSSEAKAAAARANGAKGGRPRKSGPPAE